MRRLQLHPAALLGFGALLASVELATRPVWLDPRGPTYAAQQLYTLIDRAAEEGLRPEDYGRGALQARLQAARAGRAPPEELRALDQQLTSALALLMAHQQGGRVDPVSLRARVVSRTELAANRARIEVAARAGTLPELLAGVAPTRGGYATLKEVLAAYRQAAAASPDSETLAAKVRQLELNLEARRWLAHEEPRKSVLVNIAGYTLSAYEDGREALRSRVVVGLPYRKTPVLTSAVERVVLDPPWFVPGRIAREEILPAVQKDPSYLAARKIRVIGARSIDAVDTSTFAWSAMDPTRFRYRFVQDPGPDNALGRVKLVFPNPWDVYLHDTPSRALFEREARTLSHGCIRVERALELAAWVLGEDRATLEASLAEERTRSLAVPEAVSVDLVYWTAVVEPGGTVELLKDVYGRDARLDRALAKR